MNDPSSLIMKLKAKGAVHRFRYNDDRKSCLGNCSMSLTSAVFYNTTRFYLQVTVIITCARTKGRALNGSSDIRQTFVAASNPVRLSGQSIWNVCLSPVFMTHWKNASWWRDTWTMFSHHSAAHGLWKPPTWEKCRGATSLRERSESWKWIHCSQFGFFFAYSSFFTFSFLTRQVH